MGRRELELNPAATALEQFAHDLRELRRKAGNPSYRHLSQVAHYSASALSTAANGRALPTLPVLEAYVRACEGDEGEWRRRCGLPPQQRQARTGGGGGGSRQAPPPANSAMADALRRAGLLDPKNGKR